MTTEDHGTAAASDDASEAACPVMGAAHQAAGTTANQHWWPHQLNLKILRQNHAQADPMGGDLDYAEDSAAEADCNFVLTDGGDIVEVQFIAEDQPFPESRLLETLALARRGVAQLIILQRQALDAARSR